MELKKIILLINILLTGLILWVGFNIYQTWASHKGLANRPITMASNDDGKGETENRKAKTRYDYRLITTRDIFKTKTRTSGAPGRTIQTDETVKPKENTALELMGTVVGDRGNSFAIIREKGQRDQDMYGVDDYVDDAKITKILPDRVTLDRNGTEEVLVMTMERGPAPRLISPAQRTVRRTPIPRKRTPVTPFQTRTRPTRVPIKPNLEKDEKK